MVPADSMRDWNASPTRWPARCLLPCLVVLLLRISFLGLFHASLHRDDCHPITHSLNPQTGRKQGTQLPFSVAPLSFRVTASHLYVQRFAVTVRVCQRSYRLLFRWLSVSLFCLRLRLPSVYDVEMALLSVAPLRQDGT